MMIKIQKCRQSAGSSRFRKKVNHYDGQSSEDIQKKESVLEGFGSSVAQQNGRGRHKLSSMNTTILALAPANTSKMGTP